MKFKEFYKTLEKHKYYVFSYRDVLSFFPKEKKESVKTMLYRWKSKGWIYTLKKGLYELTYPNDFTIPDLFVANKLYSPSYVSLETALSNYSIIPEVSMAVTSITTKPTRKFNNKHGFFLYRTVRPEIYTGYFVEKERGFNIFMAEPEKAVIDFIYFKTCRSKKIDFKEERLDKNILSKLNKKSLSKYAKLYDINLKEFYAYL